VQATSAAKTGCDCDVSGVLKRPRELEHRTESGAMS